MLEMLEDDEFVLDDETKNLHSIKKSMFGGYSVKEVNALLNEKIKDLHHVEKVLMEKQEEFAQSYNVAVKERDELLNKFNKREADYRNLKAEISKYIETINNYEKQLKEKDEVIAERDEQIRACESNINDFKNRLMGSLSEECEADDFSVVSLDTKFREYENKIMTLTQTNNELLSKIDSYETESNSTMQIVDDLKAMVSSLKSKNFSLTNEINNLHQQKKQIESQMKVDIFQTEQKMRSEIDNIRESLSEIIKNMDNE
ncbi:MAG: hypothetical protein Q8876_03515 [Bacillota bacterium]|nr:hypothetical protein [Bacillota bacterium]